MTDPRPRVQSVNTSHGGVPKPPRDGAVAVGALGLEGDEHHEPEPIHGGPEQAVSLYSAESIERLEREGHTAYPGAFGENLTLAGIEIGSLAAGDRLGIGDDGLVLQLTHHAQPCQKLTHYFADGRIARISGKTHPEDARWYASVLSPGRVRAGDAVRRIDAGG